MILILFDFSKIFFKPQSPIFFRAIIRAIKVDDAILKEAAANQAFDLKPARNKEINLS
jgi:hypothetical protein